MRYRLAFLLCWALLAPVWRAKAWTDAHVRDAAAKVRILPAEQRIDVALDLAVAVRGGWLERLDLTGLDEGLTPAESEPALALLEGGEQIAAKLVVQGNGVSVRFQRRDGLRRGVHHVLLRYSAPLSRVQLRRDGGARVSWTLPGWEAGLNSAAIELEGVSGLRPVHDSDVAQEVGVTPTGGVRFARLLVPRTSPWSVGVDLPREAFQGLAVPQAGLDTGRSQQSASGRTGAAIALGLLLLVAWWQWGPRGQARPSRTQLGAWCALAGLGGLSWSWSLPLSLSAWALLCAWAGWRSTRQAPLPLGRVAVLSRAELKELARQRWRERLGGPFGDIASLSGVFSAALLVGALVHVPGALELTGNPWGLGALCGLFGMISGSRFWGARSPAEQVGLLLRAAARTRMVACAIGIRAYLVEGAVREPRLRLTPQARYPGLLRLEVLVDPRRASQPLWLSAVVETDSAAERWLCALWPDVTREVSAGGRRVALLRSIDDVGLATEQLLEHLSAESQRCLMQPAVTQAA